MSQFQDVTKKIEAPSAPIKYGELIVLGYNNFPNGFLPNGFALCQRPEANGVKPSTVHVDCNPQLAEAISLGDQHSVSYALSQASMAVVEYAPDGNTDMFQIGRSRASPIDFVVTDTDTPELSQILRFACRIVCQRSPPYTTRIYSAGFDDSKNIVLGADAVTWKTPAGKMDGLTAGGVLVMHPPQQDSKPSKWREISVCGNVFKLREKYGSPRVKAKERESQQLVDGSLIDLCGVTLLWCNTPAADGRGPGPRAHLKVQRRDHYARRPCIVYKTKKDGACVSKDPQRAAFLAQVRSGRKQLKDVKSFSRGAPTPMLVVIQKTRDANEMCKLTLDPDTAHTKISLSANNRKVTRVEGEQNEHPDRFKDYGQVMSIESLPGRCYWEVEWSGEFEIAVTYRGIDRQGDESQFGCNDKSWSLRCSGGDDSYSYTVWHNTTKTDLAVSSPSSLCGRVAVYVDRPAGTVSFCTVSSGTLTHLHTFQTTFTKPLYAGFWVGWSNSSVSVCQREEVQ